MTKIACDVDLCVVDLLPNWLKWFKDRSSLDFSYKDHDHYFNLETTMSLFIDEDPLNFWRKEDLYDNIEPEPMSVDCLDTINKVYGAEIIFVTDSFDEHKKSKELFLERNFPFASDVIHCTSKAKHNIYADIWIEDRVDIINNLAKVMSPDWVIMMLNPINENYIVKDVKRSRDWSENFWHIKGLLDE